MAALAGQQGGEASAPAHGNGAAATN
jgi:hypothetical protein